VIRLQAVQQVKSMVALVDNVCINAIKTQVAGEVLQTKAPLGVSIIMAKSVSHYLNFLNIHQKNFFGLINVSTIIARLCR
jgi:hypothetical protein